MAAMERTPCVAFLPSPGIGHLVPAVAFAKRLVYHHNVSATIIVPTSTSSSATKAQMTVLEPVLSGIDYLFLPPVSFDDLPEDISAEKRIILTVTRSLSSLRDSLRALIAETNLVALIVDPFGIEAFDVANELHLSPYLYFPATAMCLSFLLHLSKLDEEISCEFRDLPEPVQLPGCLPVHGRDLLDPVQDRSSDEYKWILHITKRFNSAEGILLNSFMDLEEGTIKTLQVGKPDRPPVYPIGPLVQTGSRIMHDRSKCLQWLDNQPTGSVLFISFGSGGTLSHDQINELAMGLEMSGNKFLWVLRSPNDQFSNAAYFNVQGENEPFDFLPKGFLERTKGRGFVVPSWAPQIEVLSHGSTGGFLTHCGWNSILESLIHGVPLVAWPLYAEQKMNAVMLTEGLKVAVRAKGGENGVVGREEVAEVVKGLMEGEEGTKIRSRMRELKEAAMKALSEDGSSTKSMSELVIKWMMN